MRNGCAKNEGGTYSVLTWFLSVNSENTLVVKERLSMWGKNNKTLANFREEQRFSSNN